MSGLSTGKTGLHNARSVIRSLHQPFYIHTLQYQTHTAVFCTSQREVIVCDKSMLLNKVCSLASMCDGRNDAESFVKNIQP
jgi:hypothetical protein